MTMTVEGQGDPGGSEGESGVDMPTTNTNKRGRGRSKGSKKLQVWVTHVDLSEFGSGLLNGGPAQPLRSRGSPENPPPRPRGRPKGSGLKRLAPSGEAPVAGESTRKRGRPKGSGLKKLAPSEEAPVAGESTRKRGRPKGSTNRKTPAKFADRADDWDLGMLKESPSLKRTAESSKSEDEEDGDPGTPRKRGRPKGSPNKKTRLAVKRGVSSECETRSDSSGSRNSLDEGRVSAKQTMEDIDGQKSSLRGRGRPKGSPNKKTRLAAKRGVSRECETRSDSSGSRNSLDEGRVSAKQTMEDSDGHKSSPRGRGRPRKDIGQRIDAGQRVPDGASPAKRGRGRPKGSPNKTYPRVHQSDGRSRKPSLPFVYTDRFGPKPKGRGQPKKEMLKRGRPRKNPLPQAGDMMRPKVWKPLGRPRKYPRLDPPEGLATPRRARGRPRKLEIKRGCITSKAATPQPRVPSDGRARSRGRASGTVKDTPPRKRGRPKGSLNKSKVAKQAQESEQESEQEQEQEQEEEEEEQQQQEVEVVVEEDAGENEKGIPPLEADDTEFTAEAI
ncbi:unnamed protein product [Gadus morhua 'NCC']